MTQRVLRRLDHDFVRADTLHLVEQSFALALQLAFDAEHRKLVGNHAQTTIRAGWRAEPFR